MKTTNRFLYLAIIILFLLITSACQAEEVEAVIEITPTPTLPPEQQAIWEDWEGSAHADTYGLENGPNTYCARCHSPMNWDYAARIDPAPDCVSCKIPTESEPRVAESNQLVAEENWRDIGCEVCHMMDGRVASTEYYWFDNAALFYEVVQTTTELCEKCHVDQSTFIQHQREMGGEVHVGFSCTDCHDAHDPYVSCGSSGCHSQLVIDRTLPTATHVGLTDREQCLVCHATAFDTHSMEIQRGAERDCLVCHDYFANLTEEDLAPVYHSSVHENVACDVCHDASGLEIGLTEDGARWITFRLVGSPVGQSNLPYQSHTLTTEVNCARCHYSDNPWGLVESVADPKMD